jgi:hypothetical protein
MKRVLLNTIFIASVINLVYSQVNNMEIISGFVIKRISG